MGTTEACSVVSSSCAQFLRSKHLFSQTTPNRAKLCLTSISMGERGPSWLIYQGICLRL